MNARDGTRLAAPGLLLLATCLSAVLAASGCASLSRGSAAPRFDDPAGYRQALPELERDAARRPADTPLGARLALAYYFSERFAEADSVAGMVLDRMPDQAVALYVSALLRERAGDWAGADSIYQRRDELQPMTDTLRQIMRARHEIASREILRREAASELGVATAPKAKPSYAPWALVVKRFLPVGGSHGDSVLATGITYYLTNAFAEIETLTVVDYTRRELLEEEIARSSDPTFAKESRLVARAVGAGLSLTGRAGARATAPDEVQVQYELDDLTRKATDRAYRGTPRLVEFTTPTASLLQDLGRQVVRIAKENLRVPLSAEIEQRLARPPTESIAAFMAYAEGLLCEGRHAYGEALARYREAEGLDPAFDWAASGADRVAGAGAGGEALPPGETVPPPSGGEFVDRAADVAGRSVDELPAGKTEDPITTNPTLSRTVRIIVRPR